MKREVNANELYGFIRHRWNPAYADLICPLVAEQSTPYDYSDDWTRHPGYFTCKYCGVYRDRPPTAPHDHAECRARTRKPATPAKPVIDEAVFDEGRAVFWGTGKPNSALRRAITAAVLKDRELRSNACGGSSERSSSTPSFAASQSEPTLKGGPATDRRLTDTEIWGIYHDAAKSLHYNKEAGIRAVADAQFEKCKTEISEAEIASTIRASCISRPGMIDIYLAPLIDLLRSKGMEITK